MKRRILVATVALCVVSIAGASRAEDQWKPNDNDASTGNMLRHGSIQRAHDLECKEPIGAGCCPIQDRDWAAVSVEQYHSYEARVTSGEVAWGGGEPSFNLVDVNGTSLPAQAVESDGRGISLRWLQEEAAGSGTFLRVVGVPGQNADIYDIEFFDTTLFVPRWFNSEAQGETTSFLIQNVTDQQVDGKINFFNGAGQLAAPPVPFSIAPRGSYVLHTQTIFKTAAGSATVTHNAGWGGLVGQAARLQTGFGSAFDTPMQVRPR